MFLFTLITNELFLYVSSNLPGLGLYIHIDNRDIWLSYGLIQCVSSDDTVVKIFGHTDCRLQGCFIFSWIDSICFFRLPCIVTLYSHQITRKDILMFWFDISPKCQFRKKCHEEIQYDSSHLLFVQLDIHIDYYDTLTFPGLTKSNKIFLECDPTFTKTTRILNYQMDWFNMYIQTSLCCSFILTLGTKILDFLMSCFDVSL